MRPIRTLLLATLVALLLALSATPAAADSGEGKKDRSGKGKPVPTRPTEFPGDPGIPTHFPGDPGIPLIYSFPGDPGEPELD